MAFTFAAAVAWDSIGKQAIKSTSFQVYAVADTGFVTPLAITDPFGNAITGNILNSGTVGVFPEFKQADHPTVVITDAARNYKWTITSVVADDSVAAYVGNKTTASAAAVRAATASVWQSSTAYALNQPVINPTGDLMRCATAHTSTATYDSTKFTLVATDANGATRGALDATYARAAHFDAERYKTSTNTDLQAIQAACAAATAAGNANVVRLSARTWEVGAGLSMNGYSCGLIGMGAGHTATAPTGTVLKASTQAGAVLDLTGWVPPDSFRGRVSIGNFALQGSNVADPTKANIGLRRAGVYANDAIGSTNFYDIVISQTGGPCVDMYEAYLCDFERIIAVTPVGAKANDVPYMIFRGCNGNRFSGLGFRSISASADTGASGALVVTDDGLYHSEENTWFGPWFEYLHIPTGGTLINNKANLQKWRDVYFVDCGKEAAATGTSYVRFAPSAISNSGGNIWDGLVPGRDTAAATSPDAGIEVTQSNNLITGVKGFKGTNVVLGAGVTNTTVSMGGSWSGSTDQAVFNNSGNTTNVFHDHRNRSHVWGTWRQDELASGMRISSVTTPANGALGLGTSGTTVQAAGNTMYADADSINFRDLALSPLGFIDKFAGWQLRGAVQFVNPGTQTTAPAAGAAAALPATPAGYMKLTVAGVERLIPYY